jgi:hypothetical protein
MPSPISSEQNAWRRSYGRMPDSPPVGRERLEDAAPPVRGVVIASQPSVARREDECLAANADDRLGGPMQLIRMAMDLRSSSNTRSKEHRECPASDPWN